MEDLLSVRPRPRAGQKEDRVAKQTKLDRWARPFPADWTRPMRELPAYQPPGAEINCGEGAVKASVLG
jgi:hypothetical protein